VRKKHFSQTLNPFNKNKDGIIKSVDEIRAELAEERDKWKDQGVWHPMEESLWSKTEKERSDFDNGLPIKMRMTCGLEREYSKETIL